jgi:hypothetical protein
MPGVHSYGCIYLYLNTVFRLPCVIEATPLLFLNARPY